jgi:predicted metal-dependent peptidase
MSAEALAKVTQARKRLIRVAPFFAHKALSLRLEESTLTETMATDGTCVFYNVDFVLAISIVELFTVFAHEVCHVILCHHTRRGTRDPKEWNVSCDFAANLIIDAYQLFQLPQGALLDQAYKGLSAEKIHTIIFGNRPQEDPSDDSQEPQESDSDEEGDDTSEGENAPQDDQGEDEGDSEEGSESQAGDEGDQGDDQGDSESGSGDDGQGDDGDDAGDSAGSGDQGDDDSGNGLGEAEGEGEGEAPAGSPGEGSAPGEIWDAVNDDGEPLTPSEIETEEREIAAQVFQAHQAEKAMGKGAGNVLGVLEDKLEQPLPWNEILQEYFSDMISYDSTFARPNRRFLHSGLILPGPDQQPNGELVLSIDTSCSLGQDELETIAGHINELIDTIQPSQTTVIYCDAVVQHVDVFERGEEVELVLHGGGGTRFDPVFEYCEAEDIQPDALIYFTDGYGYVTVEEPEYPVIWVTTAVAPRFQREADRFGEVIEVEAY